MTTTVNAQYDCFWFDQINDWSFFYVYGTCMAPNRNPYVTGTWTYWNLASAFPDLNRAYGNGYATPNCYLWWFITCLFLENTGSSSLGTSMRLEMTFRYYTASGNIYNLTSTALEYISAPVWWWWSYYNYWHNSFRNIRIWNASLWQYEKITMIEAYGNYFLPGGETQYSENNFSWPFLTVQSTFTVSSLDHTYLGQWHIWVEWDSFCFSDNNWFKRTAQSYSVQSGINGTPWFIFIHEDTNLNTFSIPANDWYQLWISYIWSSGNLMRTQSQVRLWYATMEKRWLMWAENGSNAWCLWFIWPWWHIMMLWDWWWPPYN